MGHAPDGATVRPASVPPNLIYGVSGLLYGEVQDEPTGKKRETVKDRATPPPEQRREGWIL